MHAPPHRSWTTPPWYGAETPPCFVPAHTLTRLRLNSLFLSSYAVWKERRPTAPFLRVGEHLLKVGRAFLQQLHDTVA